jgi:hypothetical protein
MPTVPDNVLTPQDDVLVVDESQLLVPPAPSALSARPPSPEAPPGVLSVQQLQQLAEALAQAAPAGFLAAVDAVQLMLRMASQGEIVLDVLASKAYSRACRRAPPSFGCITVLHHLEPSMLMHQSARSPVAHPN